MSQFISIILMAIIVEGLITYAKTFIVSGKFQWQMLVGIILGITVTLAYNIDIFALLGIISRVPYVGSVLTGIIISRGSNYIFDLIKALQSAGKVFEQKTEPDANTGHIEETNAPNPS
jgi:hypothetical protein